MTRCHGTPPSPNSGLLADGESLPSGRLVGEEGARPCSLGKGHFDDYSCSDGSGADKRALENLDKAEKGCFESMSLGNTRE